MLLWVSLLYCVLQEISGCTVSRGLKATITKSVGDSVVLPCSCSDLQINPNTLIWGYRKVFIGGNYNAEHSVFPVDSGSQRYSNRVQRHTLNPPGDLSLIISDLTEEDEVTYLCGINKEYSTAVILYIRGCSVLSDAERTFTKSPGESVLLPCGCPGKEKINPQRVTWFSLTAAEDKTVSNETQSYRGRVWMFDQPKSRNFSLLISDLKKEDSGQYKCIAGEHNSVVTLKVTGCSLSENKQTVPIIRSPGESVLLSCSCTDLQDRPPTVHWRKLDHEDLFSTELHQRYRGRVQMFTQSSPGNLSVLISDLTEEDGGTYSCWINHHQHRIFKLTVKGCALSDSKEKQINRYPGESVLLPCSCTDPKTRPVNVTWEHVDSGLTEVLKLTSRYTGRIQMFNEKLPANLSLLLTNLTKQDQGTYRCKINNNQFVNLTLHVKGCALSDSQEKLEDRYPGESILLPCSCTDPKTRPVNVTWQYVDLGLTEVFNRTSRYTGRIQMFNENLPANLSLLLTNLTEQDQGTYRCTINNNQSVSMTLRVKGCALSDSQEKLEDRYSGESILLPCSCTDPKTRPVSVTWEHVDSGLTEVFNRTSRYTGRIQMFNENLPANLSLLLTNLTEQDQGTYRCTINNNQSVSMTLHVKGCALSDSQEKLEDRYPGESILLPCSCTDPKTRPVSVTWEHVDSGLTEVFNRTSRYTSRIQMFNEKDSANLSLLFTNLTEQDQGTYRCTINNNQSVSMTLRVKESQENSENKYPGLVANLSSVWVICGVLLILLLLLGAAAYTICIHRKGRKKRCEKERGQRGNEEEDVTYSSLVHNKKRKPQQIQVEEDVTYSDVAFSKKAKAAAKQVEEDVTYSDVAFRKKAKAAAKKVEEDVTYSDVAFRKKAKAAEKKVEEDVTYSDIAFGKKANAAAKKVEEDVTYSDVAFGKKAKAAAKKVEKDVTYSDIHFL